MFIAGTRSPAQIALILASLVLAAPETRVAAQTPPSAPAGQIQQRIDAALRRARLGERVGVSIRDLRDGREIAGHNASTALRPASNLKLLTAAACLAELGAEFRIPTGLYGRIKAGSVPEALYLKGYGDPTLRMQDLYGLAQQLFARGVRQVRDLVIDGSQFDDQVLPPGFEEQPREFAPFRAAVAAVSVEENAYTVQVEAGPRAGVPAAVFATPAAHFVLTNQVMTAARGPARVAMEQSTRGDQLAVSLTGTVPAGMGPLSYRRRVESPLSYAGTAMAEALQAAGIQVRGGVRIGRMPAGEPLLAVRQSPTLAQMLSMVGKYSDNFVAEMLLKVLAGERSGAPATSAQGAAVALKALQQRFGFKAAEVHMVNGSGLFGDSRISAANLSQLLAAVHSDPAMRPEFIAQLATGGVDGTLAQRFLALPHTRVVRAKTGTLEDVIALSGYVLGPRAEQALAFSLLLNGVRGKQAPARALADEIVRDLIALLWGGQVTVSGGQNIAPNGHLSVQ